MSAGCFPKLFLASERRGFYPRVSEEGTVDTGDAIRGIAIDPE